MIDWDKVILGETFIRSVDGTRYAVLGRFKREVWVRDDLSVDRDRHLNIECLEQWEIEPEWVDVTEECTIDRYFHIHHEGKLLDRSRYKAERMRIFNRRD